MYGVVLMTAMATTSATPDCWFSCKVSCGGCYGGCYGCCGGCYGCYGCGGCHGCYGGCWGCGGGCWGGCHGCYGCSGGCWGSCSGCWGCSGCYGCYGGSSYGVPMSAPVANPAAPAASGSPMGYLSPSTTVPATTYPSNVQTSLYLTPVSNQTTTAPAKLAISLPADAKLYVDGQLTTSTTENRTFTTPALQSGLTYFYDLKAEITRDGLTHTENKRVIVRSGDNIRTSFNVLEAKLNNSVLTTTASK